MKKLTSILIIGALASGCASTGNDLLIVNNQVVFPPLNVISENKYEWNDSISEALNIAKLAQPAGVGNDMRDATDGTTVTLNRNTSGNRLLEGALGFATGGLMGALSSDNLNRVNNESIEWKPSIVELVEKDTISENGQIDFRKARNYLATKIRAAISVDYPDMAWGDVLTRKGKEFEPNLTLIVTGDFCTELKKFDFKNDDELRLNSQNYKKYYVDGRDKVEVFCSGTWDISVSKELTDGRYALVAESKYGFIFNRSLINHYNGYVMVPDIYFKNSVEYETTEFAYVAKSGEQLLFQTPK
ncbi:MAG TPA: hypothetical protein DCR37_02125 [Glaciecola sp.]|nr:hypothetical protein [Glaciecola sp.]